MTCRPDASSHPRRPGDHPLESRPTPWLQALFVPDSEGFRSHLLVLVRHAISMSSDTTAAGDRLSAYARDLALVRRGCREDPRAAQELAERLACVPAMVRSRHRKLGARLGEDELSDVVQDTLVTIWSKLDRFEGRSSLETWVYGFVVRELYKGFDRLHRRPRRVEWDDEHGADLADESLPGEREDYRIVHDTIHAIGPPGSEIIRMKHFQQLTFEQIAAELEMPLGTVKTRYYRSVERLRGMLRPFWREARE